MITALQAAYKLIRLASENENCEFLTNLKIQKLLYYEQGYHLAQFGSKLFDEPIVAWAYGPVVASVYDHFKHYERNGITYKNEETPTLTSDEEELFYEVFEVYSRYSAYGLIEKTHNEAPWMKTEMNQEIDTRLMTEFFKTKIYGE